MAFDPKDLANLAGALLQAGLPMAASAFGGPLAGAAVSAVLPQIAAALGLDPAAPPAAVAAAVAADPQGAANKLAGIEAAYADIQNARQQTVSLAKEGSSIAWGAPVISVLTVIGFFFLLFAMIFKTIPDSPALMILLGALSAAFQQVGNYWLGSSKGSADKTAAMTSIIRGK